MCGKRFPHGDVFNARFEKYVPRRFVPQTFIEALGVCLGVEPKFPKAFAARFCLNEFHEGTTQSRASMATNDSHAFSSCNASIMVGAEAGCPYWRSVLITGENMYRLRSVIVLSPAPCPPERVVPQ